MSKEKYRRNELESDDRDNVQKQEALQPPKKYIMDFDLYFQKLMSKGKTLTHHKAAMRQYAEAKNLIEGTEEEFDNVFKNY